MDRAYVFKPCPFCGSRDVRDHEKKVGAFHAAYIQCHRCNARTGHYRDLMRVQYRVLVDEAAKMWNERRGGADG